jgi:hypothetical protein
MSFDSSSTPNAALKPHEFFQTRLDLSGLGHHNVFYENMGVKNQSILIRPEKCRELRVAGLNSLLAMRLFCQRYFF